MQKPVSRCGATARGVVAVGVAAATLTCGKLALSMIPNVEVVTLLTALYGYVFGGFGILAAVIFVTVETLMYGFGTWIVTYYLYWPLVAFVFMLLGRMRVRNRAVLCITAILLTVWFGVFSSLVDVGLLSGSFDRFFWRFSVYYMRGIWFYVTQIVCNAILFPVLFRPLVRVLERFLRT